ncbi:VP1 [Mycoreovirus 1]|uniref:Uncharacterized protein VP4 n=1 Tax=Cryphonectria parasitica mycoreovirus 1 (strain 9B21) TaxID=230407 RepID=VP4_MYRV9|nr:VP1 [Mycoreovirus 1]Q65YV2.1 RecName: Full=Uncharacterized protein VP4 [Cryphonectria parasitica mycoreovirus 1]BAD51414.1 VP4 [Cryphonectria parasitica mycoreovirus 1]
MGNSYSTSQQEYYITGSSNQLTPTTTTRAHSSGTLKAVAELPIGMNPSKVEIDSISYTDFLIDDIFDEEHDGLVDWIGRMVQKNSRIKGVVHITDKVISYVSKAAQFAKSFIGANKLAPDLEVSDCIDSLEAFAKAFSMFVQTHAPRDTSDAKYHGHDYGDPIDSYFDDINETYTKWASDSRGKLITGATIDVSAGALIPLLIAASQIIALSSKIGLKGQADIFGSTIECNSYHVLPGQTQLARIGKILKANESLQPRVIDTIKAHGHNLGLMTNVKGHDHHSYFSAPTLVSDIVENGPLKGIHPMKIIRHRANIVMQNRHNYSCDLLTLPLDNWNINTAPWMLRHFETEAMTIFDVRPVPSKLIQYTTASIFPTATKATIPGVAGAGATLITVYPTIYSLPPFFSKFNGNIIHRYSYIISYVREETYVFNINDVYAGVVVSRSDIDSLFITGKCVVFSAPRTSQNLTIHTIRVSGVVSFHDFKPIVPSTTNVSEILFEKQHGFVPAFIVKDSSLTPTSDASAAISIVGSHTYFHLSSGSLPINDYTVNPSDGSSTKVKNFLDAIALLPFSEMALPFSIDTLWREYSSGVVAYLDMTIFNDEFFHNSHPIICLSVIDYLKTNTSGFYYYNDLLQPAWYIPSNVRRVLRYMYAGIRLWLINDKRQNPLLGLTFKGDNARTLKYFVGLLVSCAHGLSMEYPTMDSEYDGRKQWTQIASLAVG